MGLSENVGYIPNEIAIKKRDNDQQNHWVYLRYTTFSDTPKWGIFQLATFEFTGGYIKLGGFDCYTFFFCASVGV